MAGVEIVIAVLVLGFMAFGLVGILAVAGMLRSGNKNARNAEQTLDATFDGRPAVTFHVNLTSIPFETVVTGAQARGYRLAQQSGADRYGSQTLMFERDPQGASAP